MTATSTVPPTASSFVGRARELRQAGHLLARNRVVTLVGPGGVGKTRLALELARTVGQRHTGGMFFVDLAAVSGSALATQRILETIAGVHGGLGAVDIEIVAEHLGQRSILLILDNCEHIVDAVAAMTSELVSRTRHLRVMATSREPLRITGEAVMQVPPMAAGECLQLYIERSRASSPGFFADEQTRLRIAQVCSRLDGLPLAIELAAARSRLLTPAQMLPLLADRFAVLQDGPRDAPHRHQALRAAIDWSYDLLEPDERQLFIRVAVFRGGFDLGGAVSVMGREVLGLLSGLVDKSIIEPQAQTIPNPRFAMLETLREYGLERLRRSGGYDQARFEHLEYFVRRAESTFCEGLVLGGAAQVGELEPDLENIREALEWSIQLAPEAGLRLVGACRDLWFMRRQAEGLSFARRLLDRTDPAAPGRSRALVTAGQLANASQLPELGAAFLDEARSISREIDDRGQLAWATWCQGVGAFLGRDLSVAEALLRESLGIFSDLRDQSGAGRATASLGSVQFMRGEYDAAHATLHRALVTMQGVGDLWGEGMAHTYLGLAARSSGSRHEADSELRAAVRLLAGLGDVTMLTFALAGLALNCAQVDGRRALRLAAAATATRQLIGGDFAPMMTEAVAGLRAGATRGLGPDAAAAEWEMGRAMGLDAAVSFALGESVKSRGSRGESPLSHREQEIARLLMEGMGNRELADRLHLSVRTVENHVLHILNKLGVENRTQVAVWMFQRPAGAPSP